MKKSELKELIKPIVKECVQESVQEILLESGLLSSVISEVMKGVGPQIVKEERVAVVTKPKQQEYTEEAPSLPPSISKLKEGKKRLLDSIGSSAYGGVDIFEGTKPALPERSETDMFANMAPDDPGVNLDFMLPRGGKFKQIK